MTDLLDSAIRFVRTDLVKVDWVGLGTWAVVVVAVFGRWIRALFFKPKFTLFFRTLPPDCLMYPLINPFTRQPTGDLQINARLSVKNTGNIEARQVEVYAQKLKRYVGDDRWEWQRKFTPMNLNWADIEPKAIFFRRISPDIAKYCNIGHAFLDKGGQPPEVKFTFSTIINPSHGHNTVVAGTYQLEVIVAAANARPTVQWLEVTVCNPWHFEEDKIDQVLRVRLVPAR